MRDAARQGARPPAGPGAGAPDAGAAAAGLSDSGRQSPAGRPIHPRAAGGPNLLGPGSGCRLSDSGCQCARGQRKAPAGSDAALRDSRRRARHIPDSDAASQPPSSPVARAVEVAVRDVVGRSPRLPRRPAAWRAGLPGRRPAAGDAQAAPALSGRRRAFERRQRPLSTSASDQSPCCF